MIRKFKKLSIIALFIILVGMITFITAFSISGFSFDNLSGVSTEYFTFNESEKKAVNKLSLQIDTSNLFIKIDEQADKISITYPERTVKDGKKLNAFSINESNNSISVIENEDFMSGLFFWDFKKTRVDIRIPKDRVVDLAIEIDTGDVIFEGDATLSSLLIETDTGDVTTRTATLTVNGEINIETDTGDIDLGECNIFETANICTDTGDIDFKGKFLCKTLKIDLDTGDVSGEEAIIDAETVLIETDTGDVELNLHGKRGDYAMTVRTHTGDSNIITQSGSPRVLSVTTDTGDIEVNFTE